VGKRAAIAPGLGGDADLARVLSIPLLWREGEAVQAVAESNPVEFDGFKIQVVEPLPNSEELHGVAVAQPIADDVVAE